MDAIFPLVQDCWSVGFSKEVIKMSRKAVAFLSAKAEATAGKKNALKKRMNKIATRTTLDVLILLAVSVISNIRRLLLIIYLAGISNIPLVK
jgi:hypothetical protein